MEEKHPEGLLWMVVIIFVLLGHLAFQIDLP